MSVTTMSARCRENSRRMDDAGQSVVVDDAATDGGMVDASSATVSLPTGDLAAATGESTQAAASAKTGPSTHLRVVATWLAIYPIVAVGASLIRVFLPSLPPWGATWILTGIAIPIGVYFGVPKVTLPAVTALWRRVRGSLSGLRRRVTGGIAS